MILSSLPLGTRFRYPDSGKTAVLLSVSPGGARIKFDHSGRTKSFKTAEGDDVTFDAPGKAVIVSAGSDVVPL